MQIMVKLSEQDRDQIERLHYQVEARANLLERIASGTTNPENADFAFNRFLQEYDKYFKEYSTFKIYLEQKYKPSEIAETAKSWSINFETSEMIFEVDDVTA